MDFNNNNLFNHNMNSYFTPISFDSDNSDPAMYNINNHIGRIGIIRLNTTHTTNLMAITFKIISTLHRVNGDSPPPSQIFNHLSQFSQYSFPNFDSYTPFPEPPIEEK